MKRFLYIALSVAHLLSTSDIQAQTTENSSFSTVINPAIPAKMDFAGQTIGLDRIDMFERFDRELTSLSYTHGSTLLTLKRANRFFPMFEPILKKHGIPLDLMYLACVESVLNTRAVSPAKAAGLWQFIPSTGRQYGLEINDYVDERFHIEKETEAACKYFKTAYEKYGNWESVACSYNAGMGRISSELSKQLANSAFDLYLVDETSRYMFRIMATKLIFENPQAYGFHLTADQLYQPIDCDIVVVDYSVASWPSWAKEHGITYSQLREVNPWIKSKELPNKTGKKYSVKVPKKESLYRSTQPRTVYNPKWVVD